MLFFLIIMGCQNIELPDIAERTRLAQRIVELSPDCSAENCLQVVSLGYRSRSNLLFDIPDENFFIQYDCMLNSPDELPALASTKALAQIAEECNAVDGRSHLIFPHWWETTCFFVLEDGPDYGSVRFPDYVEDPADYLYVACKPETIEAGYY